MGKVPATAAERKKNQREKMKKDGSYKIYLNKQKDLKAKKQWKEQEILEKMSDEQKDEVLKEKKKEKRLKENIILYEKETWKQTKRLQLHQKMHINLVPAREKPLQGSREISLKVLVKGELLSKS